MNQITIPEALFLGLVQGFTEWLPISSSGHLVIFESLLGISVPANFNIVIMMGTIAALILYLRKKIFQLLSGMVALERTTLTYIGLIVLSGIPTGIIGFAGKEFFKGLFGQPFVVSLLIIITGIFLFIASWAKNQNAAVDAKSAPAVSGDTGLSTPLNTNNDKPFGISHLTFCGYASPEFSTLALPVAMTIGVVGVVYVVRKREN